MKAPLVLVVDDDPDILDAICDIVAAEGYEVVRARNGLEALERVRDRRPDIILLDLMMPVMDGLTFAASLRDRYGDHRIPIVVISADGNPARAASVGAAGYLAKPFDIDTLLVHLSTMTAGEPSPPAHH